MVHKKYSKSAFIFPCHLYMSCRTHGVLEPVYSMHAYRPCDAFLLHCFS